MTAQTHVALTGVDCHAHVMRRDAPLAADRHSAPKRDCTVEEYLGVLDANAISHGVLTAPSFYGTDNSLLLDALDRAAGRLRGTVIVAPGIEREALEAMDARGAVGIRLNWFRRSPLPDVASAEYRRLFELVRDLDWQVEIYLEGPRLASVLPRVRECGVRVVVDHFGSPDPALGVECAGFREVLSAVRAGDTWVKLSAPYRQGREDGGGVQRYVDALLDAGGPPQLVWASDWPFVSHEDRITYRRCVDWLDEWVHDESARRAILSETPVHLFGFDRALRTPAAVWA
ncbi:MAG: amidohydrolase family protein [Pseudomonadota bacterium]|nr:amidohydrolase family protein [Pseudomonadota bacterium]